MRGIIQYVRRALIMALKGKSKIYKLIGENLIKDSGMTNPTNYWVASGDFSFVAGRGAFKYTDDQDGMIRPEDQFFYNNLTKGKYYILSFVLDPVQVGAVGKIIPTNVNKDVINEFGNDNYFPTDRPFGGLFGAGYNSVLLKIPTGGTWQTDFAIYSDSGSTNGFFIDNVQLHEVDQNMFQPLIVYNRVIPKPVFPFIHIYSDTQEETLSNQQNTINEVVTKIEVVDRVIGSGGGEMVLNNIVGQITYAIEQNLNTEAQKQMLRPHFIGTDGTDYNNLSNTKITNIAVKYFQDADEDHYYFRAIISVTMLIEEIN